MQQLCESAYLVPLALRPEVYRSYGILKQTEEVGIVRKNVDKEGSAE